MFFFAFVIFKFEKYEFGETICSRLSRESNRSFYANIIAGVGASAKKDFNRPPINRGSVTV